jgi:uncharacterized membrane protein (UPF0127 family)
MARRAGEVVLRREGDGKVLCDNCLLADTLTRRMRGLLGRGELKPGEGIVLRPAWSIHTFFMRFPIDVVFVDADQVVVKIVPRLGPWRTALCRGAHDVVELASGECERLGLETGARLAWAARPEVRPQAPVSSVNGRAAIPAPPPGEATRVLVGTPDDKFLRLTRFLLARNHFHVESTKRVAKTVDLITRHGADVVVIDATESLADAARTVAAIEALHPHVRVVIVHDGDPPRWTTGLKVTEKWAALETLPDDIRQLAKEAKTWS